MKAPSLEETTEIQLPKFGRRSEYSDLRRFAVRMNVRRVTVLRQIWRGLFFVSEFATLGLLCLVAGIHPRPIPDPFGSALSTDWLVSMLLLAVSSIALRNSDRDLAKIGGFTLALAPIFSGLFLPVLS